MASSETIVVDEEGHPVTAEDAAHGGGHGATEGTVAHDGGDHGGVFPPFDTATYPSQLLWLAITFVAFYFLMARVALPRIAGILESRRDRIASDIDLADRLKSETDDAIAEYEAALAEARNRAHAIGERARDEARRDADDKRSAMETDLVRRLSAAETRIGDIKAEAMRDVGAIASDAAAAIIDRLIDAEPGSGEVATAVGEAMKGSGSHAV